MKTRSELHEEKRQRRNKVIISLVMIAIMLTSTVAYAFYYFTGDSTTVRYNGHKISAQVEGGYIQGYTAKVDGDKMTGTVKSTSTCSERVRSMTPSLNVSVPSIARTSTASKPLSELISKSKSCGRCSPCHTPSLTSVTTIPESS